MMEVRGDMQKQSTMIIVSVKPLSHLRLQIITFLEDFSIEK